MRVWRKTRNEVAGAWRSLRYDMGRRADDPEVAGGAGVPDVTSTGMSTFGGPPGEELREEYDEFARPPRRIVAVSAFGILAVVGAAGSYFAVVNGLGALLGETPAAPQPYPLAADAPRAEADSTAGMGRGTTAERPATTGAVPVPPVGATAVPTTTLRVPAQAGGWQITPAKPGVPTSPDCDCLTPPVPTPTAPPSASPADTAGPSPSPSTSSPEPSPSDSTSAEPSESPAPEQFAHSRHDRGH
jgi:hypothetical protein